MRDPDSIDWAALPGPAAYRAAEVAPALKRVAGATDATAESAANALLFAVGNNHAGTLYPAAPAVVPLLLEIIGARAVAPARLALQVLGDLLSFEDDAGPAADGSQPVRAAVHRAAEAGVELLFARLIDSREERSLRAGARDVLDLLESCEARLAAALALDDCADLRKRALG